MKIRTDYVTNSSSSSFIIRDIDMDKFKLLLGQAKHHIIRKWEKMNKENVSYRFTLDDFDWLDKEFDGIQAEVKRFREHDLEDLWELYCWYGDRGRLRDILGISNEDRSDAWMNIKLSSEDIELITAEVILEYMKRLYDSDIYPDLALFNYDKWYERHNDPESEYSYFSWLRGGLLKSAVMNNYTEVEKCMKKFDGMHVGDVMEKLYDAKYLYYGFNAFEEVFDALMYCTDYIDYDIHMG